MKIHLRLAIVTSVIVAAFFFAPTPAGAGEPVFSGRAIDPVVITGAQLPQFSRQPIAMLRLFASQDGRLASIPFQVDERRRDGEYALTAGPERSEDEDGGGFDANDELVFMAQDVGPRLLDGAAAPGLTNMAMGQEIATIDPIDGRRGYVYLYAFTKDPPPPSPTDYVQYDPASDLTTTPDYRMGFHPKFRFAIDRMAVPLESGWSEDPVDILKIRMRAKVLGITIERHQEDFNAKLGGWIDGPIRLIKWTGLNMRVVLFIRSPRIWNYVYFYSNSFRYDMEIKTPFKISTITSEFNLYSGVDFTGMMGAEIYAAGFEAPYVVTGKPGAEQIARVNADPTPNDFFSVKYEGRYWLARIVIPADVPLTPDLYVIDDAQYADPPEGVPGAVPGLYFKLKGWEQVETKHFTIGTNVIVTRDFAPGREKDFFARQGAPLRME